MKYDQNGGLNIYVKEGGGISPPTEKAKYTQPFEASWLLTLIGARHDGLNGGTVADALKAVFDLLNLSGNSSYPTTISGQTLYPTRDESGNRMRIDYQGNHVVRPDTNTIHTINPRTGDTISTEYRSTPGMMWYKKIYK